MNAKCSNTAASIAAAQDFLDATSDRKTDVAFRAHLAVAAQSGRRQKAIRKCGEVVHTNSASATAVRGSCSHFDISVYFCAVSNRHDWCNVRSEPHSRVHEQTPTQSTDGTTCTHLHSSALAATTRCSVTCTMHAITLVQPMTDVRSAAHSLARSLTHSLGEVHGGCTASIQQT